MSKSKIKRNYHRQESDKVNRTALYIGGAVAVGVLVIIVGSVLF